MKKKTAFKIRPLRRSDINSCAKMAMESFGKNEYTKREFRTMREEFEAAFSKPWWGRPTYFVATQNGQIIGMAGYALSWMDWDAFEFFWLCVRPSHQRMGIGPALTKHREQHAVKKSEYKGDITIIFSCTRRLIPYHSRNGYKVMINKAEGKEVLMGKTFLKSQYGKLK